MITTRFKPKNKVELFVLDLRDRISRTKISAEVIFTTKNNVNISSARLKKAEYYTAPYDGRYGVNDWVIEENDEGTPFARDINNPNTTVKIEKSNLLNYDDWNIINTIINETADHHMVGFNLKSTTHTIRRGMEWGIW